MQTSPLVTSSAAAFVFALLAMAPKKKARLQSTFTIIALKSTYQMSKLIRALDPQELDRRTAAGTWSCQWSLSLTHSAYIFASKT